MIATTITNNKYKKKKKKTLQLQYCIISQFKGRGEAIKEMTFEVLN